MLRMSTCPLKGAMAVENVLDLFRLPMSRPDYEEFLDLLNSLQGAQLPND